MSIQKAKETIQKQKELLQEGKSYEFSQKIIMLANRKVTTGNQQESINLLLEGAKELLQYKDVNEATNLIYKAFEVLTQNKQLLNEELKSELMSIFSIFPQGLDKLKYANKILNEYFIGDKEIGRVVAIDLLNNKQYHVAQKYIINLNDSQFSISFLQKWISTVNCEVESEFFVIRYILCKISQQKLDEAQDILNSFKKDTPFYNFTSFLIRACKIKSRKAYSKLSSKYNSILKLDPSIQLMLKRIACTYFDYEKQESGFDGLFNSIFS
ncbi:golgi-to-ER traffic-like protein, putative (macronuclear) [Tetrahymena thermophila SB210]|uniref:Golgi-to-ER traffic-like protein, putative n=1 Tax=Tetrahymena thermophila (strain SB210) TaxID=312017 RepID=W7XBE4_TETTS|nr:golgi-to-ER traffic-like protein, putative [Tetrahymena thermophila SB210]EWS71001.1 golgi-to-ER traffic-like protein, putative [Tetrahymena thermophila SB210]|eukprot:XP_012656464.1 golgi-to-ER traffic-like protein, putative [Tetrahymena thermophila SB210]